MQNGESKLMDLLTDLVKINAVIATELIQLVENSSRQIRGEIPETCRQEHAALKKELIDIAEKWSADCKILRAHNLEHE